MDKKYFIMALWIIKDAQGKYFTNSDFLFFFAIWTLTWKKSSCFSGLQKKGCLSTQAVEGRHSASGLIMFSIRFRAMMSSGQKKKERKKGSKESVCGLRWICFSDFFSHSTSELLSTFPVHVLALDLLNMLPVHICMFFFQKQIRFLPNKTTQKFAHKNVLHKEVASPCESSAKHSREYSPARMLACRLSASPKGCCPLLITK